MTIPTGIARYRPGCKELFRNKSDAEPNTPIRSISRSPKSNHLDARWLASRWRCRFE